MPPLETPSPKSPSAQPPADEPRSRKPARVSVAPSDAATSGALAALTIPSRVNVRWNAAATRALKTFNADFPESAVLKRALGLATRQAALQTLSNAAILLPTLREQIQNVPVHSWFVDVSFVSDAAMRQLNREHRGKDKPTDVLSFSVWEGDDGFPVPALLGVPQIMLGDLVISIETAIAQARELKHDLRAEIAFLAAHGTLHLLGYDHASDAGRRQMFALQDEIVAQLREAKGF